jgi:hypothetical protein
MRKVIVNLFYFIIFMSCFQMNAEEDSKYIKYVHEIVNKFAKEMKQRFGLACIGSGGSMPTDVEIITVCFQIRRHVSIEEARRLEVEATEALVKMVNAHEKIRPYLRHFPFPVEDTEIPISFINERGESYTDNSVASIFQIRNRLFYRKQRKEVRYPEDLYEESYEEAYNKVYPSQIETDSESTNSQSPQNSYLND